LFCLASAANAAEAPYGGTAAAVPGTVQAENYDTGGAAVAYNVTSTNGSDNGYRSDGIDLEVTTDTGGGVDLGWSAAGQWFKYTVNVATAGKYTVTFRLASPTAIADGLHISNSSGTNLSGSVAVPATGGYQTWTSVTASVTLPAGTQTLTVNQDAAGWNINYISFAAASSGEGPYGGTAAAIPGTVMASNYDTGGQGVGYSVTSTNGSANSYRSDGIDLEAATSPATGDDLGWTLAGQWFRYTVNVSTAGTYTVSILIASPTAVADGLHISNSSGTNLSGSVAVPATGGYQTWVTVTATVTLPAGTQTLTVNQDAGGWNIDSLKFATSGGGGCTTKPSAPAGLAASGTTSTTTNLAWTATTAPSGCSISSYTVLKGGVSTGTATGTSFAVTGLTASTNYSFTVEATDAAGTSAASSAVSVTTSAATGGEAPYPGPAAAAVPGTVLAENYDAGGQGVAYNVTSTNGTANTYRTGGVDLEAATAPATGNDLGWSAAGQWFRYTVNVSTAGTYTASFLVASPTAVADALHISNSSGTNLTGSVAVPATGGYQTWVTVTANITLPAGQQTLTLNDDAAGWNIDSLGFASGGGGIVSAPITAGTYMFVPQNATGLALDDETASIATGNPIDVYTQNGTGAQSWVLTSSGVTPTGYYNLSTEGAYCLTASGTASGSAVVLDPCAGSSGQAWAAVKSGSNYTFHPANNTALCLDVIGAGTVSGTLVDAYTCNATSAQSWAVATPGSGGGTGTGSCSGVSTLSVNGRTYTPTWCQEFNGAAGPPDTTAWTFDLGGGGWGNNEAEVYCGPPGYSGNPSQCPTSFSTSTAPVYIDGNGHLVIQVRNANGTWISGRMNTSGKQNFLYGLLEASIQAPDVNPSGLWPAFWTLGSDIGNPPWPACGESDIMEIWPSSGGGAGTGGNNSTIHTAVTGGGGMGSYYGFPNGEQNDNAFHTYGMIWSQNTMSFFVDNPSSTFYTVTSGQLPSGDTWPFNLNLFTILNVAVGGNLGGSITGLNPGPMIVDYVRYYQ
jgi:beta-glucanase (GH16 family)/uncharacterized protein involved in high-affinity Fe2+ transport